ncbi:tRNA lysidine(34) synthetase TilS [Marinoscillum sp. MHG1-6]|uniref:tRNA lysidine(34) synthetase TilS n=1 Tax=Marinoscillum sp. MHG1-6 TaxID=2959627 RepID=UPI0021587498|nr:tRNA lysidine(34) synthetase TilS [Marinoscillum sp. MHG1-6]
MVESLLKFITKENLFSQEDELLLAVSGGIDSMVMAQLFLNAGIPFSIAHVNYNLRGDDSVRDRDFVVDWAKAHDVMVYVKEVDADAYDTNESIQMVARKIRYEFFESLMADHGYTRLATAHHLNDSIETVLLNLIKGTGPKGFRGIPVKNGYIIRPLMFANRDQIKKYAEQYNVEWREDSSNSKVDYQRNHIRHNVSPVLKEINPSILETFQDTLVRMEGAIELLESTAMDIRASHMKMDNGYEELGTNWVSNDKKSLLILSEILSDYQMNFRQIQDLYSCVLDGQSGKMFSSQTHSLNVDREKLIIKPLASELSDVEVLVYEGESIVRFANAVLQFRNVEMVEKLDQGSGVALLDANKIEWPLKLRNWKKGDKFVPLGMKGKKMVSDYMIDSKIPVSLKKDVLVVESNGAIVWLVGHRIDDRFKVGEATKSVLKIISTDAEVF